MTAELMALSGMAVSIGFFHCIFGPDHYVPFVAMSRVGVWSLRKTLFITVVCGIGHVLGSAVLGFVGIAAGVILFQLEAVELIRGDLAAWLLFGFGAAYMVWGLTHAHRGHHHLEDLVVPGTTSQAATEEPSAATDMPGQAADGVTAKQARRREMTPWLLFLIFLFGPCEPLIPLLMYPAAQANVWSVIWVTALFGLTTLVTMVAVVALIYCGTFTRRWHVMEPYQHALGGAVVMVCGGIILLQASIG